MPFEVTCPVSFASCFVIALCLVMVLWSLSYLFADALCKSLDNDGMVLCYVM